jgi:hypothetical protein
VVHPGESREGNVIGISNVVTDWFARECLAELSLLCNDFRIAVVDNPDIPNLLWNGADATVPAGITLNRDKALRVAYLKITFGYKCITRLNLYRNELNQRIKEVTGE